MGSGWHRGFSENTGWLGTRAQVILTEYSVISAQLIPGTDISPSLGFLQDSDRELEESHVFTQARESTVKDKRRSPPSDRPPSANPHHAASAEDQESPERVVQKEKLHAELKQVLSLKRSHLKETSHLAQAEMDSPTDAQAEEQSTLEVVEVVVETEAEAGASGYSVTGGGERGIFVKDVLKDSPAAKHLSLQQGDQLLSARVYFDNVKYEDALKILQCAEPYKVSFLLKRTVAGADVSLHSGTSLELKGPKAKMQKMSVKSIKPFKVKKKRGGRFGLKRLKEKQNVSAGAELELAGSPSKGELNPVDVEFAFPRIKMKKDGKASEEGTERHAGMVGSGEKKKLIRFPRMKSKGAAVVAGGVDLTQPEGDVSLPGAPGAGVKIKGKGHKFGMNFPKSKKTKVLELKPPDVKSTTPSVELGFPPGHKDVDVQKPKVEVKEGSKWGHRGGELSLGLPSARHSDEIDGEIKAKGSASLPEQGIEGSTGLFGVKMPASNISATRQGLCLDPGNRVADELEGASFKGPDMSMPKVDISLPETGSSDVDIDFPEKAGHIKLSSVDISHPKTTQVEANMNVVGHSGKHGKFNMPGFNVSLPEIKSSDGDINVEGPEVKGDIHMPIFDLSIPKGQAEGSDIDGHAGKRGMPTFNVSLPKCNKSEGGMMVEVPEVKGDIQMPDIDLSLPKGCDIKGHAVKGGKFKIPTSDASLPKFKSSQGDVNMEAPEVKHGKPDISPLKGQAEGGLNLEGYLGKGGKFQMPTFDVSLPEIMSSDREMTIEGPELECGRVQMPSVDISLPKCIAAGVIDIEGHSGNGPGGKFKIPSWDISLPETKGGASLEGADIKGGISFPKAQADMQNYPKDGTFHMPSFEDSLPKIKSPECDMDVEGPDIKGGNLNMHMIDFSIPKGKTERDITVEGDKFDMPSLDISPPKFKLPESERKVGLEMTGGTFEMPEADVSPPKGKTVEEIKIEAHSSKGGKFKMPKFGISFPKMKSPEGKINIEGPEVKGGKFHTPDIDISLLSGKEVELNVRGDSNAGGKFHSPTGDISLPTLKSPNLDVSLEAPEAKGWEINQPKVDISIPKGSTEGEAKSHASKGGRFHMPSIDLSLPKNEIA
ncbi:hypothetical protein UPYG_G00195590 [Umbra pygmaea]|uniref:Periaxin n=1 Tax=Umbra pygmaea TaxID=75934 RepID=A0ABD0X4Z2_UMBPY